MSWTDIDLANVSTAPEIIPESKDGEAYTFQLLPGAKRASFDPEAISVRAAIAEGEFAGRQLFFTYPNPAVRTWSPRAFKILVESLGEDLTPGEHPVEYLNRVAGLRFSAPVKHRKDDTDTTRVDVQLFKVRPAA